VLRVDGDSPLGGFHYQPVIFHEAERATADLRMLLALLSVILCGIQGKEPATGVLICGRGCQEKKAKLAGVVVQARRLLREVCVARTGPLPNLVLNSHCQVCEFRQRCQTEAIIKDEMSLLRSISEKEIKANLIAGNIGVDVYITGQGADHNVLMSNFIGTDGKSVGADGRSPYANSGDGVLIDAGAASNTLPVTRSAGTALVPVRGSATAAGRTAAVADIAALRLRVAMTSPCYSRSNRGSKGVSKSGSTPGPPPALGPRTRPVP
jgi:hypothetical protein